MIAARAMMVAEFIPTEVPKPDRLTFDLINSTDEETFL